KSWEAWWKDNSSTVDLAKVELSDSGVRAYTLMTLLDGTGNNGKVIEQDASGKTRWSLTNLRYPIFAVKTRRDRVVIGGDYGNSVSERPPRGAVLWEKVFTGQVVSAQRLPSGNLFVAPRNQLVELTGTGKEVRTISRGSHDVLAAYRHRDGKISIASSNGQVQRLDSTGRMTSSFYVGSLSAIIGLKIHFLENGHVLAPNYSQSGVTEYDASGKNIWSANVYRPSSAHRMANGHTIVGTRFRPQVFELDKSGGTISTRATDGRPIYVEKR